MQFHRLAGSSLHRKPENLADGMAIFASLLCLVHCLALPVLLAAAPSLSQALAFRLDLHLWIVLIAGPVSAAILLRAMKQRRTAVFAAGMGGLALLILALVLPPSEMAETLMSSMGSIMLAGAHLANWQARHSATRCPG